MDLEVIRQLRGRLRNVLPDLDPCYHGIVSDNTLSACLGVLAESTMIRLVQEIQRLRGTQVENDEAKVIMEEITKATTDSISTVVLKYVPDATIFHGFRSP